MTANDDFELHRALEEVAPSAVRALVDMALASDVGAEERVEALTRLRWMRSAALFADLPLDLRHEAERLLDDD
jgi:hypothetical protein